jgi:carbamoyltransferase
MPLAPAVLESEFSKYFTGGGSTNMAWTVTSTARARKTIPAAIHANGEARVQVVPNESNRLLSRLIDSFRELTGTGVLLLTSLNGKDEPIALNIEIATGMAKRMGVDGMITDFGWWRNTLAHVGADDVPLVLSPGLS